MSKIERISTENGRMYSCDGILYPSVTTVISHCSDKSWLELWRKERADHEAYTAESAKVGTDFHDAMENFGNTGEDTSKTMEDGVAKDLTSKAIEVFHDHISEVIATEIQMFSKEWRIAGTADLIAIDKKGNLIIGDYKNARRPKLMSKMTDYGIQTTMYAQMVYEITGEKPVYAKIISGVWNEGIQVKNLIFSAYRNKAMAYCEKYHAEVLNSPFSIKR